MGLADRLGQPPGRNLPGPSCTVGVLLDNLPDSDAEALAEALDRPDVWPGSALARALRHEQHQVSDHTINRHRRGDCMCQ